MHDCCAAMQDQFDDRTARRQLRRYRKRGAARSTRLLIEALEKAGTGESLLDIGGGIGMIQDALLHDGVRSATVVDASAAYLAAAEQLAVERGYRDRLQFLFGDFVAHAASVAPADTVTLDRVICCYPDMAALVSESAARARRLYGIVVPRETAASRLGMRVANTFLRLSGSAFRGYVHPLAGIEAIIKAAGLRRMSRRDTVIWTVRVYTRV
jgi:2-polyprenyl-3-methyl-5-hydroxy-6-metoxy-1,4-benzoquinol methylase